MADRLIKPGRYAARYLVRFTLIATFVLMAAGTAEARGRSPARASKDCKKDNQCVLVAAECCGCNEGGVAKAIPARDKAAEDQARAARCGGTVCIQVMSTDPSCSARAVCRAGQCTLSTAGAAKAGTRHHRRGRR